MDAAAKILEWVHPLKFDEGGRLWQALVPARGGDTARVSLKREAGRVTAWCRHFPFGGGAAHDCEAVTHGRLCYHVKAVLTAAAALAGGGVRFGDGTPVVNPAGVVMARVAYGEAADDLAAALKPLCTLVAGLAAVVEDQSQVLREALPKRRRVGKNRGGP